MTGAERLRYWFRRDPLTQEALSEALADERRATVKRIFEAAHRNSRFDGGAFAALRAILDEEAAR